MNTHPFPGVYWRPSKRVYRCEFFYKNKPYWLGGFKDPEEAAVVRDHALRVLHGPNARLTLPDKTPSYPQRVRVREVFARHDLPFNFPS